jgi:hypothetical protein
VWWFWCSPNPGDDDMSQVGAHWKGQPDVFSVEVESITSNPTPYTFEEDDPE